MTILETEPIYVGRIERAPTATLGKRVIKIIFLLSEDRVFRLAEWQSQLADAFEQIQLREALLHGYYEAFAIFFASQEALDNLPIVLAPERQHWVLGSAELFSLRSSPAGNWSDSEIVKEAKSVLGAQIYRLDALLIGASGKTGLNAEMRRASIQKFCAARLHRRLDGFLRATGSRKRDWQEFVEELRTEFGAPALRVLYGDSEGAAARLKIGTHWRREGRAMAKGIELDAIDATNPYLARDIQHLDFAADLLVRTAILERDGVAAAVRKQLLDDENMAAIVDIESQPDLKLATDAARHWNINLADYFYGVGAMRGHFDAVRALGTYERTGRVELTGLARYGIRAILREEGDALLGQSIVQLRRALRDGMPKTLVDLATEQ